MTEYVVTRWYRAPEIMLSGAEYTYAVDVWSAGCIFGEMLGRTPLFPGNDYIHQIRLIMKVIGTPDASELWFVNNEKAIKFVLGLPRYEPVELRSIFPLAAAEGHDLLSRMILLDPSKRVSAAEALEHPYLEEVREEEFEAVADREVDWTDIETCELTRDNLRRLLVEDIRIFHPER